MFKTLFICFAAVAVASADKHAAAGEAADAGEAGFDYMAAVGAYVGEWGAGTLDENLLNYIADDCVVDATGNGGITASSAYKVYPAGEAGVREWLDFLASDFNFTAFEVTLIEPGSAPGQVVMHFDNGVTLKATGKNAAASGHTLTVDFNSDNKMTGNTFAWVDEAGLNDIFIDDADGFDNTAAVGAFLGEWGAGTLQGNEGVYAADNVVVDASGAGGITASSNYKLYDAGIAGLTEWLVFLDTFVFDQFEVTLIEPSGANHAETVVHMSFQFTNPSTGKTTPFISGNTFTAQFDEANKMTSITFAWADEAGINDSFIMPVTVLTNEDSGETVDTVDTSGAATVAASLGAVIAVIGGAAF